MTTEAFGALAGPVVARLVKHLERALAPVDLTLSQYRLLSFLTEGEMASSNMASWMAISPPSVTSVVDGLAARGLVQRQPDPRDRRRQPLVLTADGLALLKRADHLIGERLEGILDLVDDRRAGTARSSMAGWKVALDRYRVASRQEGGKSA